MPKQTRPQVAYRRQQPTASPNAILRSWIKHKDIGISEFGRTLGYKSNLANLIVGPNPTRKVTFDTLGRIYKAYRATDLLDTLTSAMQSEN